MERLTLEDAITHAKEVAEKNYRGADFESLDSIDDDIKANCIKCAEEHELLLRLPVPIGTIVYCIYTSMTGKNATILADRFTVDMCKPWGTFVFATEEEAEKKLEEMKNDGSKK